MTPKVLVVASWNIQKNGRAPLDGRDHSPRPEEILAAYKPDIVFRQELSGAGAHGKRALYAEAHALGGLIAFMGAEHAGRSKNPVGVMANPRLFDIVAHTNDDLAWKQICHLEVRRKDCPRTLHLASAHLCHYDPHLRATEARRLTTYADHGHAVLIGMDATATPTAPTTRSPTPSTGTPSKTPSTSSTAPSSVTADASPTPFRARSSPAARSPSSPISPTTRPPFWASARH
ncbi:endonuclease/exonuclease/phosphatase family protein [Streptomyces sp. NBC_00988]|uniref:endonuclease/exonuclease/phosphatase family protein n=1 Tax=Streptomyces sp. NBC_00988 TaxID=2903704 RepID=UPI003867EE3B|nr:endonuclease/exonuclease/phosphatase family protein [Streptomyces sp. NBC_00988]